MNNDVNVLVVEHITIFYKIKRIIYLSTKRIVDILFSLIGLLFLIPISIIIKICYMVTGDFTSIFFIQDRIGKNGKHFKLFKYRSMVPNADEILFRTLELDKILDDGITKAKEIAKNKYELMKQKIGLRR